MTIRGRGSELRRIIKAAGAAGWTVEQARSGHLKWRGPRGQLVVSAYSPSDRRALRNLVAHLRREGVVL